MLWNILYFLTPIIQNLLSYFKKLTSTMGLLTNIRFKVVFSSSPSLHEKPIGNWNGWKNWMKFKWFLPNPIIDNLLNSSPVAVLLLYHWTIQGCLFKDRDPIMNIPFPTFEIKFLNIFNSKSVKIKTNVPFFHPFTHRKFKTFKHERPYAVLELSMYFIISLWFNYILDWFDR